jgi:monoamine oxidase
MQVVVIGAGVAGLAAAQALSAAEVNVSILEARDRVGGRIHTLRDTRFAIPVELGAEFIHGRPSEIFSIVGAAGLSALEVEGPHRFSRGGKLIESENLFSSVDQIFATMSDPSLPDQTFSEFLAGIDARADAKLLAKAYVEGFNAAQADRIGVRALADEMRAADAIDSDRSFRIEHGYDRIAEWLWRECKRPFAVLHLKTVVTSVRWHKSGVEVGAQTDSGHALDPFVADCAVITLPLGVLHAPDNALGAVRFVPKLTCLKEALDRLSMGQAVRITLTFSRFFWEQRPELSRTGFIHSDEKYFPTWWTTLSPSFPALTGWSGGPKAEALAGLSDSGLAERAIESLCHILGVAGRVVKHQLESYSLHNWCSDPFARGAYSYAGVAGQEARRMLASPIENTLFFAGEATDVEGHGGTVHGAIATGKRAARAVIDDFRLTIHAS